MSLKGGLNGSSVCVCVCVCVKHLVEALLYFLITLISLGPYGHILFSPAS